MANTDIYKRSMYPVYFICSYNLLAVTLSARGIVKRLMGVFWIFISVIKMQTVGTRLHVDTRVDYRMQIYESLCYKKHRRVILYF